MRRSTTLVALLAAAALLLGACGGDDDEQGLDIDSGTSQEDTDGGDDGDGGDADMFCIDDDGTIVVDSLDTHVELDDEVNVDSSVVIGDDEISVRSEDGRTSVVINGNEISTEDFGACTGDEDGDDDNSGDDEDDDEGDDGDGTASGSLTSTGDYTCDGSDVSVDGVSLNVDLVGECGSVTVNGNDNNVNIERATTVSLNGAQHNVDVVSADEINLSGASHNLDYTGNPTLNDNSVDSDIN
jgi:hypothetical protein